MMPAKSPKGSQAKGRDAEREVLKAEWEMAGREWPYVAHSRPDDGYKGPPEMDGIHQEIKRRERLNIYTHIAQAQQDAGGKVPSVVFRQNRGQWWIALPLAYFLGERATFGAAITAIAKRIQRSYRL